MPAHWTYEGWEEGSDLEQGDILTLTDELRATFHEVHPHFCDPKYSAFIVASQSCDLVKRGKPPVPKAGYITLAVVRPLVQVVSKLLAEVAVTLDKGVFSTRSRPEARQFLNRLFNQNEQLHGLFFLYQDADSGVAEESVAFLRVSVALRTEHYSKILDARRGRLTAEFRAKLGWLLGNLYSRPATKDWGDTAGGAEILKRMVEASLEGIEGQGPIWLDPDVAGAAKQQNLALTTLTKDDIQRLAPKQPKDRAIEEIERHLQEVAPELGEPQRKKLLNRIKNSREFSALFTGR